MAWASPLSWSESMVTAAIMNQHIRDNFLALSTHNHDGTAGNGGTTLQLPTLNPNTIPFVDQTIDPSWAYGMQRNGNDLVFHNGTVACYLTGNGAAAQPSARTLGTGATQAAAGDHIHS